MHDSRALNPFKIIHHDMDRKYPIHIEIDPTAFCNHDCIRCSYTQDIDGERGQTIYQQGHKLALDRFLSFVDECKAVGLKAITFSGGGEPLSHPEIDQMMEKTIESQIEFGVITNLSVKINHDILKYAVWVRVSLDAATTDMHTHLHRPAGDRPDFDRVLENITQMRDASPSLDIGVNFIIQPENYHQIYEAAMLVKHLKASYIRFVPAIASTPIDYFPFWPEIQAQQQAASKLADASFTVYTQKERFIALEKKPKNYSFCYKQKIHPLLGADGIIYPCCQLKYYPQHALGNIYEHSFTQIWDGEQRNAWLAGLDVQKCPACWFDQTNEFIEYMLSETPPHVNFV